MELQPLKSGLSKTRMVIGRAWEWLSPPTRLWCTENRIFWNRGSDSHWCCKKKCPKCFKSHPVSSGSYFSRSCFSNLKLDSHCFCLFSSCMTSVESQPYYLGYMTETMNWPQLTNQQLLLLAGFLDFAFSFISCYPKRKYSFSFKSGNFPVTPAITHTETPAFSFKQGRVRVGRLIHATNIYSISTVCLETQRRVSICEIQHSLGKLSLYRAEDTWQWDT